MKKLVLLVLVMAVLTVGLFAQDTTWTNPYAGAWPGGSMISAVSNGTIYDGLDVLLTSPAELSEFEGVSLYTAYGNYESWADVNTTGVGGTINPFTTGAIGSGFYQLGYLMPVMGMQAGVLAGFENEHTGNLTGWGDDTTYSEETTDIVDSLDNDGTAEYSSSESFSYTDYEIGNSFRFGTGIDLGFMGVSLGGYVYNSNQTIGGTYNYEWTIGADADFVATSGNYTTSKTIDYGYKDGEASTNVIKSGAWGLSSVGQLPFAIGDISMPITASLSVSGGHDGVNNSGYGIPQTVSITDAYATANGAAGAAADVSTLKYTQGVAIADFDTANTIDNEHLAVASTANATWADVTALSGNYANDADNIKDSNFSFGFSAQVDPKIVLSDIITARIRAKTDFDLSFNKDTEAGIVSLSFSEASSAAENSTYTYNASIIDPNKVTTTEITMELGGILEAENSTGFITVSSGLFYNPTFTFGSTANEPTVETIKVSANDSVLVNEAIDTTLISEIGLGGGVEGTITETTTTTYTGKDKNNEYEHRFTIPISTRINLKKDKLSLIGGYVLSSAVTQTTSETAGDDGGVTVKTIAISDGTSVTPVVSTSVSSSTTTSSATSWATNAWAGRMSFMVRWMPTSELTVDFFGQSIMTALNMDIFGGTGFNVRDFIADLGMSVTYRM